MPAPGSRKAVDPAVNSADWSEVFVIADKGAFQDMAQSEFSGHLIGMIIAHVDDMLLADDKGVLSRRKRIRTVPDDMKSVASVSATRPDRVCGGSSRVCQYASSPSPKRGSSVCDPSVDKGTISAPGVRPQAHFSNYTVLEGSVRNLSGVRLRSTKWYMLVYPTVPFTMPRKTLTRTVSHILMAAVLVTLCRPQRPRSNCLYMLVALDMMHWQVWWVSSF